ncbi:AzlD domain-containing protein [Aeromonas sobria]|uniref:AzlD domain-containing protein n=1 Tax=Aeromonas sobria TaxID=646 RepID=UPI003D01FC4D
MDSTLWIAMLAAAAGTFLLRMLPLLWMQRHLDRRDSQKTVEQMPVWLRVLGPAMIAAMFGVSVVPATLTPTSWLATLLGGALTLAVWYRTRSLGWPVFAGVAMFGVVKILATFSQ